MCQIVQCLFLVTQEGLQMSFWCFWVRRDRTLSKSLVFDTTPLALKTRVSYLFIYLLPGSFLVCSFQYVVSSFSFLLTCSPPSSSLFFCRHLLSTYSIINWEYKRVKDVLALKRLLPSTGEGPEKRGTRPRKPPNAFFTLPRPAGWSSQQADKGCVSPFIENEA